MTYNEVDEVALFQSHQILIVYIHHRVRYIIAITLLTINILYTYRSKYIYIYLNKRFFYRRRKRETK